MPTLHTFRPDCAFAVIALMLGLRIEAAIPPPLPDPVEQPQAMQEWMIDTLWTYPSETAMNSTGPDHAWYFGPTGRFVLRSGQEHGKIDREVVPNGFPPGDHAGYTGDWTIRSDGLRLRNIRVWDRDRSKEVPASDEQAADEQQVTLEIKWAQRRDGQRLMIDGRRYGFSPRIGGVALKSLDQLQRHLSHGRLTFVSRGEDAERVWFFQRDGTFAAWLILADVPAGAGIISQLPADASRVSGRWDVAHDPPDDLDLVFSLNKNKSQLVLSDVRIEGGADDGRVIDKLVVPLGWVDGKLRIEIDGVVYMRRGSR